MKTSLARFMVLASTTGMAMVSSLGFAQTGSDVAAQSTAASTDLSGLEEVTVTARRREESAQTVPISISAFSEASLVQQDIRTVTDLDKNIPGLSFCCARGQVAYPFIRGVPGVLGYFSEVPASLNGSALYFDINNVQVLKGPQGTLFGLSTNGGAVLYEPRRPEDTFGGSASVTLGNYGRRTVEGIANIPLSENVSLRLGVQSHVRDGFIIDRSTGRKLGDENYWVGRASLNWELTDTLENYFVLNYYSVDQSPVPYVPRAVNPTGAPVGIVGSAALQDFIAEQASLGPYAIVGLSTDGTRTTTDQYNVADILTWKLSDSLTLKNVLGYQQISTFSPNDVDGSPFRIYDTNVAPSERSGPTRQISEELQLQGVALGDRLNYTVGVFYSETETTDEGWTYNDLRDAFGIISGAWNATDGNTRAVYAEGTYALNNILEGLSVTGGYRHTWDEREILSRSSIILGSTEIPTGTFAAAGKWDEGSYRIGLTYQPSAESLIYLMNSVGYSSGGFNASAPLALRQYDPESLQNLELGVKSQWYIGGMEARTNFAVYFGKYDDIQVPVTSSVCDDSGNCTLSVLTRNAAEGEIKGVEFELAFLPIEALRLSLNGSWMDAEYTSYPTLDSTTGLPVDLSATPFVYLPEWKYSTSFSYALPAPSSWGEFSVSADYSWQDEVVTTSVLVPEFYDRTGSFDNLDLRLSWRGMGGRSGLNGSLFVTNALQNETAAGQFGAYRQLGLWGVTVALPRMFGVRLDYEFE